jgi:hypothetical protein
MSETTDKKPASKSRVGQKGYGGRKKGSRSLTPAEKAAAAAAWRAGEVTLAQLSEKYKKRPETFSRLFGKMGIKKGEAAEEVGRKVTAQIEARAVTDVEQTLQQIAETKKTFVGMHNALARLAFTEIKKAVEAKVPLSQLRLAMQTLQSASAVISKSREEIYTLLQIEKHDDNLGDDDLPELLVRELTAGEVKQLAEQDDEEKALTDELNADGMNLDEAPE